MFQFLYLNKKGSTLLFFCSVCVSLFLSLSFLLLLLLLLARRLEHNAAGVFGGALYYDSCSKLDKSCFVQGVGPLSGSRAILLRNNRARAGGAVYVECSNMGRPCAEAFNASNKIGTHS